MNSSKIMQCDENVNKKSISLLKTAWLIALVIVISKVTGFFRDVVIAKYYGVGLVSDAYFYAYQIPSLMLILFGGVGGPFHSAIVSVFSKIVKVNKKTSKFALNLFNTFVTAAFIVCFILALGVFLFSDVICQIIISGGNPDLVNLASTHLKIMSPILVIGGLIGIYYGILVTYNEFLIPNISPMLVSFVIILVISFVKNDTEGYALALATTLGALVQFLFQLPKAFKLGYKYIPTLSCIKKQKYKNILELLYPSILSSTVGQIYIYVDMFFASQLETGAWTAIGYANRIFQFPVGILVTAFLVPLFPLFSKLVFKKDYDGIIYYFNKGIGLLNFAAFPILIGILLFSHDAVMILFERGQFDSNATKMVTIALIFLSVSIIPYIFRDSLTRIYFAFNDSKTPFYIALSSVLTKVILNFIFVKPLGIGGITLSTSFVTLINGLLLGFFIRKKIKIDFKVYLKEFLIMFLSAILVFLLGVFLYKYINVKDLKFIIIKDSLIFIILCILYSIITCLFNLSYAKELYIRIKSKIFKV